VQLWPINHATCALYKSSTVLNLRWRESIARKGTAFVCVTSLTANWKTSHCVTFISTVLLTADMVHCKSWRNLRPEFCLAIVWLVWTAEGDWLNLLQFQCYTMHMLQRLWTLVSQQGNPRTGISNLQNIFVHLAKELPDWISIWKKQHFFMFPLIAKSKKKITPRIT